MRCADSHPVFACGTLASRVAAIALAALLAACGGGGGGNDGASSAGGASSGLPAPAAQCVPNASGSVVGAVGENFTTVSIDRGPACVADRIVNLPYVSVRVCPPGSTAGCQVIDKVLVDTASYGLRLVSSLLPDVTTFPLQLQAGSGNAYAQCAQFVSGYTFGSVRTADITIGGLTAAAVPIQAIGDPALASVPASCVSTGGGSLNEVRSLGANGILGIGYFARDCGAACVATAIAGAYYSCTAAGMCTPSTIPLAQQVANPVALLPSDNNGVLVELPAVVASGVTALSGSLVLGIGTRANNSLGGATAYRANSLGLLSAQYKGRTLTRAFFDTGSNFYFFDDASLRRCSGSGLYCPATTQNLSVVVMGTNGASTTVTFAINDADSVFANNPTGAAFANLGAPLGDNQGFDFGLPFHFGRRVFTAIDGAATPAGPGPYTAF